MNLITEYYVMQIEDEFNKFYHYFSGNDKIKHKSIRYLKRYQKKIERKMKLLTDIHEVMEIDPYVDVSRIYMREYIEIRNSFKHKLIALLNHN